MTIREEDTQFIAKVYSYIFIGIMLDWIKNDMREEPKRTGSTELLAKLLYGSITAAIERVRI